MPNVLGAMAGLEPQTPGGATSYARKGNTMKRQVNIRVSNATREKLDSLKTQYGTQAEVIAVAIDRLNQEEMTGVAISASDLWDRFAPEADPAQLAMMSVQDVSEQVNELRGSEGDTLQMTDARIASTLILYAQDMIQKQDADNA